SSVSHYYSQPGTYTVTLKVQSSTYCYQIIQKVITVHANLSAAFSYSSPPFCVGQEISFTDNSIGSPAQWNWSFGDGGTSTVQDPTHAYSSQGIYHVNVSVADSFCGAGSDSAILNVYGLPNPQLRSDTVLCTGETQLLDANTEGASFLWSTGDTTSSITFVMPDTDALVWVKVFNNGCSGYDSAFFKNHCVMLIPSAFSPNGDGKNDFFRPLGSSIQDFDFIIYNRWGEKVFSKNSGDIHDGWDGTLNGTPQPVGVYVYYLSGKFINGETFTLKGSVTLVR
ncbi:MAG: PKD domain-containing protein, partial [Chitinophagales bacterium]